MQITPQLPDSGFVTPPRQEGGALVPARTEPGAAAPVVAVSPEALAATKMVTHAQRSFEVATDSEREATGFRNKIAEKAIPLAKRTSTPSARIHLNKLFTELIADSKQTSESAGALSAFNNLSLEDPMKFSSDLPQGLLQLYAQLAKSRVFIGDKIIASLGIYRAKNNQTNETKIKNKYLEGIEKDTDIERFFHDESYFSELVKSIDASEFSTRQSVSFLITGLMFFGGKIGETNFRFCRREVWREDEVEKEVLEKGIELSTEVYLERLGRIYISARQWKSRIEVTIANETDQISYDDVNKGLSKFLEFNDWVKIRIAKWRDTSRPLEIG